MQQKTVLNWLALIGVILLLVGSFTWMAPSNVQQVDVPTANEIATAVLTGITIPEVTIPELDNKKINDLWKVIFGECNNKLKTKAETHVLAEIDMDEIEDYIKDNIANFDKFRKHPVFDTDKTEVVVNEIGYCVIGDAEFGDDEDDKSAEVKLVYDFTYEDDTDNTNHKDSITVIGTITYDEGKWSDRDVEFSYSL